MARPHKNIKAIIGFFLLPIAIGLARLLPDSEKVGAAMFAVWLFALGAYTIFLSVIGIVKREPGRESRILTQRTIRVLGKVVWTGFGVLVWLALFVLFDFIAM